MKIAGLQKMTLLDFPGKIACTVFLKGCNFRCPFCHNSQLLEDTAQEMLSREKLLDFLKKRQGLLEGVCITGGEPTLSAGLEALLEEIRILGFPVKLDTNGTHPEILKELVGRALVSYVAMDIKNSPAMYAETCGKNTVDLSKIEESIRFLLSGVVDYELRTTVVEPLHTARSMEEMAQWIAAMGKAKQWYLQSFVDRETVAVSGLSAANPAKMAEFAEFLAICAENVHLRGTS